MTFPVLNSFSSASTLEPRPRSSLALSLTLSTDADPSTGTLCSELLVGLPETFLGRHPGLMASHTQSYFLLSFHKCYSLIE